MLRFVRYSAYRKELRSALRPPLVITLSYEARVWSNNHYVRIYTGIRYMKVIILPNFMHDIMSETTLHLLFLFRTEHVICV